MTITTGSNPRLLKPGIQALFGLWYKQWPDLFSQVLDTVKSDANFEEYVNVNGLGMAAVKPQTAPATYADMGQGYISRLQNLTYALGYILSWENSMDNKYMNVIKQYTPALARSMKQTKETVCFNVLNDGFNSAKVGGDGVSLFNTAHPKTKGGTYSNVLATPQDLSENAVEQALNEIGVFEDDAGLKINAMGMKIIVPLQLQWEISRILNSTLQNDTANNAINALNRAGVFPGGIVVSPYLDDPDAWFIKTDVPNGLIYQERFPLTIDMDGDFDSKNQKWLAIERYCAGWANPLGAFASPGA